MTKDERKLFEGYMFAIALRLLSLALRTGALVYVLIVTVPDM